MCNHTKPACLFILMVVCLAGSTMARGVSIKGYFTVAFKNTAYQTTMVNKVIAQWKAPAKTPATGKKTVYLLKIDRNGRLISRGLNMSSGSKSFDGAALACIERAAPFAPLPASFPYANLEVHFHFEIVP